MLFGILRQFLVLSFRLQVAPGSVELRPGRSQEVRGSPQLQNGGLRALEEAWMTTFCLRHFPVKFLAIFWWKGCQITRPTSA